ncbi:MAG: hypothetical protein ORN29_09525 [Rhodoferax sp.]|nr:hypothetical protein [Rhodoferax sp.]
MALRMLRWLVLLLLLANGAYFAWGQGYLKPVGLGPASQSEPQRLAQQIHPEAIQRLSAAEFQAIQEQLEEQEKAAAQTPEWQPPESQSPACWQAGPLDARQTAALRQQLTKLLLPADSWLFVEQRQAGRVVRGKKPAVAYLLRLPAVDAELDTRLEAVRTALGDKPLVACD